MKLKDFIKRNSLAVYFISAYVISWSGILLVAAQRGFDPRSIELNDGILMFLCMVLGPSLSSVMLTAFLEGKAGLKEMFGRMTNWKVGWSGYLPILTVPILSVSIMTILSVWVSPAYAPGINIVFGLVIGALAGFLEEIGWTGFALPRLQARYGVFASGLILGSSWAVWHMMADYWGNIASFGGYWFPHFFIYWIVALTAYRILMAWVYKRTNSLLLSQLMHMFYTGTLITVTPAMSVKDGFLWEAPFAVALWCLVVIVFGWKVKPVKGVQAVSVK